jgi:hypothetical protein
MARNRLVNAISDLPLRLSGFGHRVTSVPGLIDVSALFAFTSVKMNIERFLLRNQGIVVVYGPHTFDGVLCLTVENGFI